MNPLYNQINSTSSTNNMFGLIQQFKQFKQSFAGDPREQVQQLLNSGKVSQDQYNNAVQMANALQGMMK